MEPDDTTNRPSKQKIEDLPVFNDSLTTEEMRELARRTFDDADHAETIPQTPKDCR